MAVPVPSNPDDYRGRHQQSNGEDRVVGEVALLHDVTERLPG
jgi:hypothetical protein